MPWISQSGREKRQTRPMRLIYLHNGRKLVLIRNFGTGAAHGGSMSAAFARGHPADHCSISSTLITYSSPDPVSFKIFLHSSLKIP